MAFKENLTPIEGDNLDETKADFMNMKFGEVHGNTLDNRNQISILSTSRGYKDSKALADGVDLNTIIENGVYAFNAYQNYINMPNTTNFGFAVGNMLVYKSFDCPFQVILPSFNGDRLLFRKKHNTLGWSAWKDIAITEKIDISFPFNSGFAQASTPYFSKLTVNTSLRTCRLSIACNGTFPATAYTIIGVIPSTYRPIVQPSDACRFQSGTKTFVAGSYVISPTTGEVNVYPTEASTLVYFNLEWDY